MVKLNIKGNDINIALTTGSSIRYADLFRNKIYTILNRIGVNKGYVRIKDEPNPMRKAPAEVTWYMEHFSCYYSYGRQEKYVDNLQVISKVLEVEITKILAGKKTIEEFAMDFQKEDEISDKRKEARKTLGLDENETNMEVIDKAFKTMARTHHPDLGGDAEDFKKINEAHKLLRKELE
jgi:hypothetical protein